MKLADGIRKHGFRKWYERELLLSHAHLVLTFLCAIGVFAAFEAASNFHSMQDRVIDIGAAFLCAGVGIWALRRYLRLLASAEVVARQANCPQCKTYGRLELIRSNASGDEVQVRCRQCKHGWHISG